ncbi:MAG: hypothetical protein P4L51_28505 [Puia sp.]|nr:hypothetical protein [Puia sp.]
MKSSVKALLVAPAAAFVVGTVASAFSMPSKVKTVNTTFYVQAKGGTQTLAIGQTIPSTNWTKETVAPTGCTGTTHTCYVTAALNETTGTEQVITRVAGIFE